MCSTGCRYEDSNGWCRLRYCAYQDLDEDYMNDLEAQAYEAYMDGDNVEDKIRKVNEYYAGVERSYGKSNQL